MLELRSPDATRRVFDRMASHSIVSWSVLVFGYVENGEAELALGLFECIPEACGPITPQAFVAGLRACCGVAAKEQGVFVCRQHHHRSRVLKVEALKKAEALHSRAAKCDCELEKFVASTLVDLYARCGALEEARGVFERITHQSVVATTALMLGYAEHGEGEQALEVFTTMVSRGCEPDSRAYLAAIKACISLASSEDGRIIGGRTIKLKSLERGMGIHLGVEQSCDDDIFVASSLVDMYAKCGSMADARKVFDKMRHHSVVPWTALVLGYADNQEEELALELLSHSVPNALTFVAGFKACAALAAKEEGKKIQGQVVKLASLEKVVALEVEYRRLGLKSDLYVENTLVDVYANCGSMLDARSVFDRMECRSTVSWTALVMGYAENDESELALELFYSGMQPSLGGCAPSALCFVAAMRACCGLASKEEAMKVEDQCLKLKSLDIARQVYRQAVESGFGGDIFVANSAVDLFAKCGSLVEAHRTFEKLSSNRTTVSWNALMQGYADNGEGEMCWKTFSRMQEEGCIPDARTFFAALKGCVCLASKEDYQFEKKLALERGRAIHLRAAKYGCCNDVFVTSTLVELYARCGILVDARKLLDEIPGLNLSAWVALIQGYADRGEELAALEMFESLQSKGFEASVPAFITAVKACAGLTTKEDGKRFEFDGGRKTIKLKALDFGMAVHAQIERSDHVSNTVVANSLVDMYSKCGSLLDARRVFDERTMIHSVASWNTMILGYAENGEPELALELFSCMGDVEGYPRANSRTLVAALKACSMVASLGTVRTIHRAISRLGMDRNEVIESSLVDAYGKCGNMVAARLQFDAISRRDLVTWNALVAGYARQGDAKSVLGLFPEFQEDGLSPDERTFVSILTALSRAGMVDKARKLFAAMSSKYGVSADMEHYHCMIDVLGRANRLEEALALAGAMPFEATGVTWMTLLAACGKWKNALVGKIAFQSLVKLDQMDAATYVSMANIYHGLDHKNKIVLPKITQSV